MPAEERQMVEILRAFLLMLASLYSLPAWATTDCRPAESRGSTPGEYAVIAYLNTPDRGSADRLRRHIESTVLGDYIKNLGYTSPTVKALRFVPCMIERQETSLEEWRDIEQLKSFQVAVAVWRTSEDGKPAVAYAVVPQLLRGDKLAVLSDSYILFVDKATLTDPLGRWSEAVPENTAALQSLIGLGLGMEFLDKGEAVAAKLALCKSRKDLQRAFGNLLRPPQPATQLNEFITTLIGEADRKSVADRARPSPELQRSVNSACAP